MPLQVLAPVALPETGHAVCACFGAGKCALERMAAFASGVVDMSSLRVLLQSEAIHTIMH